MIAPSLEEAALAQLDALVVTFGPQLVGAALSAATGGVSELAVDAISFAGSVLHLVMAHVDADRVRALLEAQYAAADAAVDALEDAKFGKK